jgi:hypothetical protein
MVGTLSPLTGIACIDGLSAGDAVTAEQMRALVGAGLHPLAGKAGLGGAA